MAVVGPDNKVVIRTVKAAQRVDNLWVIDEGLVPGDRVIVEGLQKVKQDMVVTTKPSIPEPESSPKIKPQTSSVAPDKGGSMPESNKTGKRQGTP